MENKELQEVVEAITDAILAMEERFNKKFDAIDKKFEAVDERFDTIDKRFDKMESRLESIKEEVKGIRLDMDIIDAKTKKQEFDIKRLKSVM